MTSREFEEIWAPLVGTVGATWLRRYRTLTKTRPLMALMAVGAGVVFASGSTLGDIAGVILVGVGIALVGAYNWTVWRATHTIGAWFGVKRLGWNLQWTPQQFDEWRKRRGLMPPEERLPAARDGPADS